MGCGSSSLKGEGPSGLANDQPQPIRKVATNFSTVNYDADTSDNRKRRMTEYAPEETIRNKSEVSATAPVPGGVNRPATQDDDIGPGGEKVELEPYQTLNSNRDSAGFSNTPYPHETGAASSSRPNGVSDTDEVGGPDPTSHTAKDKFAEANDPIQNQNSGGLAAPETAQQERKRSWIDKLKGGGDKKEISDEDMKKVSSDV
ncbi:uncharacterized protein HMPREF1541_06162 [Cyphellophora europaea CBS 101466]|uniref:Uncharacterized protein n=1 Tax=Cyphellophora europaea (strain CBS 101466) TaxID=1220924 RepID=W2RUG4_CYPE1|nr:uncharacterized protein HMPREF1541_06162 [Cyphellophora europaea CBS 101466]ETN39935.1 hypothetical protein HMPREF1541_06162 [Cyphellophora europaea CBS 101466]